mmetsp:Transcript_59221/g.145367  ORF Transcript_59221/g.145367 Transcript_59221/m.145367 type:complete len:565 (+) Transcript_59221:175-1869(+)
MLRAALLLLAVGCASGQVVYGWQTYCSPGCNSTDIGNQMCDFMCMTADCTYDAADCFGKAQGGYSIRASVYDLVTEYDLLGAPDGRLNSTEFEAYLAQTPVFNDIGVPANMPAFDAPLYDTYDLSGRGGLDAYELALYFTAVLPPAHDMMAPSPSVDWDLWAQDTSLFILAIADTDSSGSLSQAEAASVLRVSSAQFMMVSAGGGDATARSLAMVLGNFGSVLFGDGLMPGVDASGMAGLLVQLFDHTGDMALSLPETLPLGLSPEVFMALDINKNGLVDAVELRDFMEVFSANPCGGYAELVGTEVHVTAQVPLLARTCTWLVNPQWHYDVSIENSNSTLLQVAKDMFGHMPPPPAPNLNLDDDDDDDNTCIVCLDRERDALLLECGHGGLCVDCATALWNNGPSGRTCPMCRKIFTGVMKLVGDDEAPPGEGQPEGQTIVRVEMVHYAMRPDRLPPAQRGGIQGLFNRRGQLPNQSGPLASPEAMMEGGALPMALLVPSNDPGTLPPAAPGDAIGRQIPPMNLEGAYGRHAVAGDVAFDMSASNLAAREATSGPRHRPVLSL